ncbi:lipoprotein [Okibacterium endophyticum]
MNRPTERAARLAGAMLVFALVPSALAGCADQRDGENRADATPHGYIEGAEENTEPQTRLIVADTASGDVELIDLLTEQSTALESVQGASSLTADGRYAYVQGDDGLTVLDGGAWTVDHGDHSHYYSAEPSVIGSLPTGDGVVVAGDTATAVFEDDGTITLLEREQLDDHRVETADVQTVTPHNGVAVPVGDAVLRSTTGGDELPSGLELVDGDEIRPVEVTCTRLSGTTVTRRGILFGCAEGAVLIDDETLEATTIPYPDGTPAESLARSFAHRPASTVIAALADNGVWSLDLDALSWMLLPVTDPVAVSSAGAGMPVLALDGAGTLHAFDPATAEPIASAPLLESVPDEGVSIVVDTDRAYVNDPHAGVIHEIDYLDDLREARVLTPDVRPDLIVETGW